MTEAQRLSNFDDNVFPLFRIPNQILDEKDLQGDSAGPATGRKMAIDTLKLIESDFKYLGIGTVKETKNYGNTSVSMGLATVQKMYLERSGRLKSLMYINIINYGSGGPKFQRYKIENGKVTVDSEVKLRGAVKYSFQDEKTDPEDIAQEMEDIIKNQTNWKEDEITLLFVTGNMREKYMKNINDEDLSSRSYTAFGAFRQWGEIEVDEERFKYYSKLTEVSEISGYYMPQNVEGTLELIGIQEMYKNLAELNDNYSPPIASFGIGGASTQFAIEKYVLTLDNLDQWLDMCEVLELNYGMKNFQKLLQDGPEELSSKILSNEFFRKAYNNRNDNEENPIVALKSGALLQRDILIDSIKNTDKVPVKEQSPVEKSPVVIHTPKRDVTISFYENGQKRTFASYKENLSRDFKRLRDFFQTNNYLEFKEGNCLIDIISLILDSDGFKKIDDSTLTVGQCLGYLCASNYLQGDTQRFSDRLTQLLNNSPDPLRELNQHHQLIQFLRSNGLKVSLYF